MRSAGSKGVAQKKKPTEVRDFWRNAAKGSFGYPSQGKCFFTPAWFILAGEDGAPKRLSGSELARAVLKQQENQRRAAEAVQLAWRKRKVRRVTDAYVLVVVLQLSAVCLSAALVVGCGLARKTFEH